MRPPKPGRGVPFLGSRNTSLRRSTLRLRIDNLFCPQADQSPAIHCGAEFNALKMSNEVVFRRQCCLQLGEAPRDTLRQIIGGADHLRLFACPLLYGLIALRLCRRAGRRPRVLVKEQRVLPRIPQKGRIRAQSRI